MERLFDGKDIQFDMPTIMVKIANLLFAKAHGIRQCGGDDARFGDD